MKSIMIQLIGRFAYVLEVLILIRCILSWFSLRRDNTLINLLYTLTEPILEPIRGLLQRTPLGDSGMMIDFSPIVAMLLIQFVSGVLIQLFR